MQQLNFSMPVIGILRGVDAEFFRKIVTVSYEAGLQAIEVTMNTPGAVEMIEQCRPLITGDQMLGMGTICNIEEAKRAIDAGAMFLVTPSFSSEVIEYATSCNVPVVSGALTPTEVYDGWSAGAAMIKVFPCQAMGGPQYIKDLRGPFDNIPLVAVGGVSSATLQDYFAAGAAAVGVATSLFGRDALSDRDISSLAKNIREFTSHVSRIRSSV